MVKRDFEPSVLEGRVSDAEASLSAKQNEHT